MTTLSGRPSHTGPLPWISLWITPFSGKLLVILVFCVALLAQAPLTLEGATDQSEYTASPVRTATPVKEMDLSPDSGLFYGIGIQRLWIQSEELGLEFEPRPPFGDGGNLLLGWNWGELRLEFIRQVVRRPPPEGFSHQGMQITQFGFDSNQLWLTHGFRPWRTVRMGYGIGYQERVILLHGANPQRYDDAGALAGVMVDYAFAAPFVLHLRLQKQAPTEYLEVYGQYAYLAYVVPF